MHNQDQEIPGTNINIHTISTSVDITICTSLGDIRVATEEDAELHMTKKYIIRRWQTRGRQYKKRQKNIS